MIRIDKKSMIPLHYQIRESLLESISTGKLKVHDPILTELELCKNFGLSRTPVRQALGDLVKDGILYRERGKGTFVSKISKDENKLIGVLVPCIKNVSSIPYIVRGIEDVIHERGYNIILCNTDNNVKKMQIYSEQLISKKTAGVIFYPMQISSIDSKKKYFEENLRCVNRFIRHGIKVVLIDKTLKEYDDEGKELDYVITDNFQGAYKLTSHLISMGHRRIGFLSPVPYCPTVEDRLSGYKKALEDNAINFDETLIKNEKEEVVKILVKEFLVMEGRPSAIFAIHDIMARDVMMVLREEGINVPDEMAVVAYDDLDFTAFSNPPLTTVRQPLYDEGRISATVLIDSCEGKTKEKQQVILKSELVIRESCGARLKELTGADLPVLIPQQ